MRTPQPAPGNDGPSIPGRLLRLAALVEAGRYVEAEGEAQSHSSWQAPTETNALFDVVRLLDQCSASSDTDLRQRRFGLVNKLIVEPLVGDEERLTPQQRGELAMRLTRALLSIGADRDARLSLAPGGTSPSRPRAIGCSETSATRTIGSKSIRSTSTSSACGSRTTPPARLAGSMCGTALALAYFHSDKLKEAAQLIDSTAILHPELGGGMLHDKFIRLRQRLGVKP